jgi:cobalt-zinc-cadmium efflux system membrane fusion protein
MSLPPPQAARVGVGAAGEVAVDERRSTIRLAYLSPVVDPETRQVRAIASLANPGATWRIGESVKVSIALAPGSGQRALAVPAAAVQTVEDKPSVFVREKDGFSIRHVVLGQPAGGYVSVQSGLDGSERIAVANTYVLKAEHGKGEAGEHHD